jgi:DNA-binding GntR family transcriptional regulator
MRTTTDTKKSLPVKIADTLRSEICRTTQRWLPSIRKLRLQYNVSFSTMQKAMQVLKKQGLVAVSQGRRVAIIRTSTPDNPSQNSDTAIARLAQQIGATIESGQYRIGQSLPKYMHYTLSNHVSSATVAQACALLDEKKIVHKSGRRWVVGPPQDDFAYASIAHHSGAGIPTVLMLVPKNAQALEELDMDFLRPFIDEFLVQMAQFNVRCLFVQSEVEPSPIPMFACGRKEILALIQSCRDRFLGTLIPVQWACFPDLKEWIEWLQQFKKPVVWYDFTNYGDAFGRNEKPRGEYYRCCSNESALVDLALETCSRMGHRTLGCPLYYPYSNDPNPAGWFHARRAYMEQAVKRRNANLSLVFPQHKEKLWEQYDAEYYWKFQSDYDPENINRNGCRSGNPMRGHIDFLAASLRKSYPNMSRLAFNALLQQKVFASVPSLMSLVQNKDVTAILAPNQWLAVNYLEWLRVSGIQVPREISLISFDNYYSQSRYPITVIDPRIGDLGYKSAHVLIKDIAVKTDRVGRIVSNPKLIDRGSLGIPRPRGRYYTVK